MPWRAASPERGTTSPAWPAGSRPRVRCRRSPARRVPSVTARMPRGRGPRRRVRARRAAPRRGEASGRVSPITLSPRRSSVVARRRDSGANRRDVAVRKLRADQDAVLGVAPLVDRRPERVEIGQRRPSSYGTSSRTSSNRSANALGDALLSSPSPSPVRAETWSAAGKRFASRRRASGSSRSILFSDELDRQLVRADLAENRHRPRRSARAAGPPAATRRRRGGRDRRPVSPRASRRIPPRAARQAPDEPDGVGDEVPLARRARSRASSDRASRRAGSRPRPSAPVSAFSSVDLPTFVYPASATVGVSARLRSLRRVARWARGPSSRRLQQRDAAPRDPAVGLELRLARAARADAAAEPLEVLPHAAHARQVVLELRELDLELALGADGVLREDVEDQLRAVDDARRSASSSARCCVGSSSSSTISTSAPRSA